MSIDSLKSRIPDFAKDVRLNLSSLASDETLTPQQKYGLMVACGIASRNPDVRAALVAEADAASDARAALAAAKSAAAIMGMNNVYYRFTHLVSNNEYRTLPAKLRMNVIGNPGVDKVDFELWSLAVSAINGCGMCMDSHEAVLKKAKVPTEIVQTAVRFAAIIQSAAIALRPLKRLDGSSASCELRHVPAGDSVRVRFPVPSFRHCRGDRDDSRAPPCRLSRSPARSRDRSALSRHAPCSAWRRQEAAAGADGRDGAAVRAR